MWYGPWDYRKIHLLIRLYQVLLNGGRTLKWCVLFKLRYIRCVLKIVVMIIVVWFSQLATSSQCNARSRQIYLIKFPNATESNPSQSIWHFHSPPNAKHSHTHTFTLSDLCNRSRPIASNDYSRFYVHLTVSVTIPFIAIFQRMLWLCTMNL